MSILIYVSGDEARAREQLIALRKYCDENDLFACDVVSGVSYLTEALKRYHVEAVVASHNSDIAASAAYLCVRPWLDKNRVKLILI